MVVVHDKIMKVNSQSWVEQDGFFGSLMSLSSRHDDRFSGLNVV